MPNIVRFVLTFLLFLQLFAFAVPVQAADEEEVRIGVLSFRSKDQTLKKWTPTAQYLTDTIPGYSFQIVPMFYPELEKATEQRKIDFVLTNSGHYITLVVHDGIERLATLKKMVQGIEIDRFGGVIFTRSDRDDINSLKDLDGKSFIGVGRYSLGGFLVGWESLLASGVDPLTDFSELLFNGMPHDDVVTRVINREIDAGTVRTSILESMSQEGRIDLADLKVLGQRQTDGFPFVHSTNLYPEWPISKLTHTSNDLAKSVLLALFNLSPDHEAAKAGGYAGWIVPKDYRTVRVLMENLRTGPFSVPNDFNFADVLHKYETLISAVAIFILISVIVFILRIMNLNKALYRAKDKLERSVEQKTLDFRATEGLLENLADQVPGAIYQFLQRADGTTCFPFASRGIKDIYGVRPEDIKENAESVFAVIHPDDFENVALKIKESGESLTPWHDEFRVNLPEGNGSSWREGYSMPERLLDGSTLWHGFITNIDKRKLVEETLQKSEENYRRLIEQTQSEYLIYSHDKNGVFQYVSPSVELVLGYTPEEFLKHYDNYLTDNPINKQAQIYTHLCLKGEVQPHYEIEILGKDGHVHILEISETPAFDGTGNVMAIEGIAHDITDRKMAEQALENSRNQLTMALEGANLGLWDWNPQTDALVTNDIFLTMLGHDPKDFPHTTDRWDSLVHPDDLDLTHEILQPFIDGNDDIYRAEFRMRNVDGKWRNIFDVGRVTVRDGKGKAIRFVGVHIDITDRVQAERELKNAKESAEKANLAKSEFLSSMSQELRTPLNAILGFAQILELDAKTPLTEQQKDETHQIIKGGEHLLNLINDVLNLSRIEAGRMDLEIDNVSTQEVLEECLPMVENLTEKLNIKFKVEGFSEKIVKADKLRLKQILFNLLSNAIKYNRPDGTVTITSADTDDGFERISIRDTGVGIPAHKQSELFVPFSRLGHENTDVEGTGIGLTITLRMLEAMGGRIGFESTEGTGSVFWLELPLADNQLIKVTDISEPSVGLEVYGVGTGTILYIEDNPSNVTLMETILEDFSGIKLEVAHTAEIGLSTAAKVLPDLILMDINLPGMNGLEALVELRNHEKTSAIPVIAISADARASEIEKGMDAGFLAYLTKPFNVSELLTMVSEVLDKKEP
ncbi:MAG: hypothetical protein COB46_03620 [Rhodospirillaceae bacterium]|nr:MAG: hypothetical protein COB46_03620 [Rhodospirillaceae bacterium]